METPQLLVTLALALAAALIGSVVALRLRQSTILGYLLAGVLIGPFTPGPVGDIASVQVLADIGVIFLLFAIGVQLSFRQMLAVGRVAIGGGILQVVTMIGLGYVVGIGLGLQPLEALFLGAVVSNSSSTVLSKILDEQGETGTLHGRIGFAWSSVQDLSTVVLIVLLSALATGAEGLISMLLWSIGKAVAFLAVIVPVGLAVLPWVFTRVAELRNREAFILTVTVVALGTAYVSSFFGLSLALGAFLAGIVVGESDLSLQILGEVLPLRDIFSGLFFVSVGMLINPAFIVANIVPVLIVVVLIVLVKGPLSALITVLFRYPPRTALLTGVGLAQSAEFSFLLAAVGVATGALAQDAFNLMLAGTVLSIVVVPWLYKASTPLAQWLEAKMPISPLATIPDNSTDSTALRGHAVICGYGRVGRVVGAAMQRRDFEFVVIDSDPSVVAQLRKAGQFALLGNAAHHVLLERAAVERARVLVVAIPDPIATRQILAYAGTFRRLDIVVRTHSESEREFFSQRGASEAVLGELELALEMTRHTLHRFGLTTVETQAIVNSLRGRGLEDSTS